MKIVQSYGMLIFGLGLNYIFNVMVARTLGVSGFGDYSYAIYLFNIISLIAVFSLDQAAVRFIPQSNNPYDFRIAIQQLAVLLGILFSLIYALLVFVFIDDAKAHLAYLFTPSVVLFVLLTVNVAILQAEHIVAPRMVLRYIVEPVAKILIFFIIIYFFNTMLAPVISLFFALLITNVAALIGFRKRLFFCHIGFSKKIFTSLCSFVFPMSISNIISVVSGRLDLIILGVLVSASDLGHYTAAFQTASILAIVLQGIETVYAPIFSMHIGSGNFSLLKNDYRLALRWAMMISSPLLIVFILYPEIVMLPFGAAYSDSALLLSILCCGQFFVLSMGGTSNTILMLMGKTKVVLLISIVYVFLTSLLVGVGAKYFGSIGAASGVVLALATVSMIRVYYAYRLSLCQPFDMYYYKIVASFLLVLLLGHSGKSFMGLSGLLLLPIVFVVFLIVFGIHHDDKQKIKIFFCKILGK